MKNKNQLTKTEGGLFMKKTNKLIAAITLLAVLLVSSLDVYSQNFTNNTNGTYTAGACTAVIKMKSTSGTFNGTAQLGTGTGNRIDGIVDWAATSGGQTVQALYYTNLFVSGGSKTIPDGVYVSGTGCPTAFTAYAQLQTSGVGYAVASGTGNRTYAGTFHYDGTSAQIIFPENGGSAGMNRYNNLDLAGSAKSTNGDVILDGLLNVQNTATLTTADNFTVGNGASVASGNITANGSGKSFTTTGTGTFTVDPTVSFTVDGGATLVLNSTGHFVNNGTLALTAAGNLSMGPSSYLEIANAFTNASATHTNMTFDATSTVAYTGTVAQTLQFTSDAAASNNYGNLVFVGAGTKTANGDVYSRGTVSIAGGPIVMDNNCGVGGYAFVTDVTGGNKITYASANNDQYIQGQVKLRGTFTASTDYTLNNAQTKVAFGTIPDGTNPYFALSVQPNTLPTNQADFDLTKDVKRCITVDYSGTAGVISHLRVGYTTGDLDGTFNGDETKMRFAETWSGATQMQKITGGAGLATNGGAANPRYVDLVTNTSLGLKLNNPSNGGTTYELGKNSNILLTSQPLQFIAINNGRWTNPGTWDEGVVPSSTDNTLIRATVYAGIAGPAYGTSATNNTTPETTHYGQTGTIYIANSITIDNGTTYPDAALIIGNEDNGDNAILTTQLSGTLGGIAAGFYNNNSVANSADNWNVKTTDPTQVGKTVNGLYVTSILNNTYTNPVRFGTAQVTNAGTIVNHSIIEIGQ